MHYSGLSGLDHIADVGCHCDTITMNMKNIVRAAVVIAGSVTLCAAPAMAEQLRFTGQTTANVMLIKETLRNIQLVGQGQRNCGVISAVDARVLPESYLPTGAYRVGKGKVVYETWSTTMCGDVVKFLISFWPAPDGGTLFAVGYPYPADAP